MKRFHIHLIVPCLLSGVVLGIVVTYVWLNPGAAAGSSGEGAHDGEERRSDAHGTEGGEAARGQAGEVHEEHHVALSKEALDASHVEVATAAGGELEQSLTLPGHIVLNADNVAHVVPRAAGIVRRVDKYVGDDVQEGEVMAILESRELAEGKAMYLATQQRLGLAEAKLNSAEQLHAKQIMSDLEFLARQTALTEAQIDFKAAENKLHALGVSEEQITELPAKANELAIFELRAPLAGTVIQKHCSPGEVLGADAFMVADLSKVRANITVYSRDIARVRMGQKVQVRAEGLDAEATAVISYIAPVLDENTRAALARVDLPNEDRRWRPGMFVSAQVEYGRESVRVLVPIDAVQRLENKAVVFVAEGDGFEARPVVVGRSSATHVEVVSGLEPQERYAAKGAFMLKADLVKGAVSHEH